VQYGPAVLYLYGFFYSHKSVINYNLEV